MALKRTGGLRIGRAIALASLGIVAFAGTSLADAGPENAILSTFEQISAVPRCSKDEGRISAWLVDWARSRNIAVTSDENRNVLITIPATAGWEARPGIILQAHMDMVCLKRDGSTHDFSKDPIVLERDGDWIHAKDTTLGADNGIGIAIALTVAERLPAQHPKLELLFTTDEEKDMTGIGGLQAGTLTGKRYINLDSEEEGVVTLGAAGGVHTDIAFPLQMKPAAPDLQTFELSISGLLGGHSGVDIDKNRANANSLAAQILAYAPPFHLAAISGGNAGNAIATAAKVTLAVEKKDVAALVTHVSGHAAKARADFPDEKTLAIGLTEVPNTSQPVASAQESAAVMALISAIPQGVTEWSAEFPKLPETSNNIGIVGMSGSTVDIASFQRSFHADNLAALASRIAALAEAAGASSTAKGAFPAWPPNSGTGLYKAVTAAHLKLFGTPIATEVIHAGLECGYIAERYPAMEIISIGPTLQDVHTTREGLKVSSLGPTWALLQEVLQSE